MSPFCLRTGQQIKFHENKMTEPNEQSPEAKELKKFQLLKNTLASLYVQVESEIANDVRENILPYVIDLRTENSSLRQQLVEHKKLIAELVPIAERHVYMHGNDDSVVDRRSIIVRAKLTQENKTE